jgi:hypothetical protein
VDSGRGVRSRSFDYWLNDLMICYVEKEILTKIDDKKIMLLFYSYSNHRGHLPRQFHLANMDSAQWYDTIFIKM